METIFCKECNAKHIVGEPCTVCMARKAKPAPPTKKDAKKDAKPSKK